MHFLTPLSILTTTTARTIADTVKHVVNFNLPYLAEDYVHHIGRTGRAGRKKPSKKGEGAGNLLNRQDTLFFVTGFLNLPAYPDIDPLPAILLRGSNLEL